MNSLVATLIAKDEDVRCLCVTPLLSVLAEEGVRKRRRGGLVWGDVPDRATLCPRGEESSGWQQQPGESVHPDTHT